MAEDLVVRIPLDGIREETHQLAQRQPAGADVADQDLPGAGIDGRGRPNEVAATPIATRLVVQGKGFEPSNSYENRP